MSTRSLCGWIMLGFAGVTWLLNLCYAHLNRFFDARLDSLYLHSIYANLPLSGIIVTAVFLVIGLIFIITGKVKQQ